MEELHETKHRLEWHRRTSAALVKGRENIFPDETDPRETYPAGSRRSVRVNAFERNPKAPADCISYHGSTCTVCDLDFKEVYGRIGTEFIQVHHVRCASVLPDGYEIVPGLAPVPDPAGLTLNGADQVTSAGAETPWKNGTTHVEFEPVEFIAKLAALVPPPRAHLTRFHGVFPPNATWRAQLTPSGRGKRPPTDEEPTGANSDHRSPDEKRRSMTWAQRLKRVCKIDVNACGHCGGTVRIVASIEEPKAIRHTRKGSSMPRPLRKTRRAGESALPTRPARTARSCREKGTEAINAEKGTDAIKARA